MINVYCCFLLYILVYFKLRSATYNISENEFYTLYFRTAQSEYKMVKAQIKEEKMQLRGILSSAPECVKQNWAYSLSNNILGELNIISM